MDYHRGLTYGEVVHMSQLGHMACLYNLTMHYFDRTFFKFLFGFICLVSISIAVIAYARGFL